MIRYLIVDDEHFAHTIIKDYCDALPNMKLMEHCYDAIEALEYLSKESVDLIFLDLNMPKLKGFEFLKTLSSPPKIIVTTAYSEFALESYELNVVDYLLKPFSFQRFLKAINKVTYSTGIIKSNHSESVEKPKQIFLRESKSHTQVLIDDILYLEASGNYTKVITVNKTITVREKISEMISNLPSNEFLQVHKSFAIALKHIERIEGFRIFIKEFSIPIGKIYKAQVNKLLD